MYYPSVTICVALDASWAPGMPASPRFSPRAAPTKKIHGFMRKCFMVYYSLRNRIDGFIKIVMVVRDQHNVIGKTLQQGTPRGRRKPMFGMEHGLSSVFEVGLKGRPITFWAVSWWAGCGRRPPKLCGVDLQHRLWQQKTTQDREISCLE